MRGWCRWRGLPVALTLAGAVLAAGLVFSRITVRTNMADFLPRGGSEISRLILDELRSGVATNLIMLGVEGASPHELARISESMTAALRQTGLFTFVDNSTRQFSGSEDEKWLFSHRYLISPATTPDSFTVAALHTDMERLLGELQSSASPIVQQFGFADPTGAFIAILKDWIGPSRVRSIDGVWFAPQRNRTLILARTRAGGVDLAGQEAVDAAIRQAFAASRPGNARLLTAGPAVFARIAAHTMRADVQMISILSTVFLSALLLWRFRSVTILLVVAIPVVLGVAAGALLVQLVFGFVHGVTIGFGMTMLGVTLDYPVLLVGHRKEGEAAPATLQRIGQAFRLTVLSATLGLTGMLFSGFPGLSQLGCFSVAGVIVAAAVTRWVLPALIIRAELAPVAAGDPTTLLRIERLRTLRGWGAGLCLAVLVGLVASGGPHWQNDLAALSPVPGADFALDAELRHELGAPDAVLTGLVHADSVEAVLQKQEQLRPALDQLIGEGVLSNIELAARFIPSVAMQRTRQASLPPPDTLAARVSAAQQGLPFRAGAFQQFIDDVAASRAMAPLTPSDVTSPTIAARIDPLLLHRGGAWYGLIAPTDLRDPARFAAVLQQNGAAFVDLTGEANAVVTRYTRAAWRWLGLGASAALLAIAVGIRDVRRVAAVGGAIAAAVSLTVAVLAAAGTRFSLIHIVSLQFVAGVGLDYALFFARRQLDREERARTLRTLAICNAMTLMTFGLLALCRTPLLRQIGITVAAGALFALVFAFLFAGEPPRPTHREAR